MKIRVHPLFLAVGLLSAIFGGLPLYIISVLTALLHECGHIFYAERLGFECKKISLMPYGAAALCDIDGISPADEIKLALSGPAVNFFLLIIIAGLWWFIPQTYAYTDLLFYANAAMLILNLLPAYPLDGGRIAGGILKKFLKPKKAELVLRVLAFIIAVSLGLSFIFYKNFTLLAASALLICSALTKSPPAFKIDFSKRKKRRGREVKYIILNEGATYREALGFLDSSKFVVFQFYGERFLDEITEDELIKKLQSAGLYDEILQ